MPAAARAAPIRAAVDGEVFLITEEEVVIKVSEGKYLRYGHIQPETALRVGEKIEKGADVGTFGNEGWIRRRQTPHLHLELGQAIS